MNRPGQGFSRLNLQPESEILTRFADVKSRMDWTPERRERLGVMWNRGDKTSDIAAALGCKAGAVNVARARFGLKPRRVVSGRPKEPDEPAHKIERVAFTTSRLMEFCTEKELRAQTGHETYKWPLVIVKELVDNGIDACEATEVAPVIKVTITTKAKSPTRIVIEDNGPGIPSKTIKGVIDYDVRISSNEAYISPTRGRQGNALKTILPMAYVLDGKQSETLIEAQGVKHRILFSVNQIKHEPIVNIRRSASRVKNGTRVTVLWPEAAKIDSPELEFDTSFIGSWEDYEELTHRTNAKVDLGKVRELLTAYIWCNPHLTITFKVNGKTLLTHKATDPGWSKYRSCDATSAHWYGPAEFERYAGALIARDMEQRQGREKTTVRDFIEQFRGMSATAKQKEILGELGVSHMSLHRFFGSEAEVNHARMKELLRLLQKHTRPVRPELLGMLGAEHLRRMVLAAGGEPNPNAFKYFAYPELKDGMPEVVEIALCPYKAWVAGEDAKERMLVTGVNFSATLENPFDTMKDLEGLTEMLVDLKAGESAPIIVCVHYACPQIEYLDRGKSRIALE